MTFLEKIRAAQKSTNSMLCVGLDTDWRSLPESLANDANPVLTFNKALIEATKDLACCYKLQMAYYEAYGERGIEAVRETLAAIPSHIVTIADVKRGDIGATTDLYAYAYQDLFDFDAVTINPLMG